VKERAKKHPADDTKARPFPQKRQLEMKNPAKQKKTNKEMHIKTIIVQKG
jgi:hypothetical protein